MTSRLILNDFDPLDFLKLFLKSSLNSRFYVIILHMSKMRDRDDGIIFEDTHIKQECIILVKWSNEDLPAKI